MRQFEYMTTSSYLSDDVPSFNVLGREGWELVAVSRPTKGSLSANTMFYWKRELPPPAEDGVYGPAR
jgi:hypothetical protein